MQSVFNIKRISDTNSEKQIQDIQLKYDKLRKHTTEIEIMNDDLRAEINDFDNIRLKMVCVDIINKVLLIIIICYILTTTSHGFSKIISHGFSFFDWISFFLVIMTYTSKLPRLIYWFDHKREKYNRMKKKPY